MIDIKDLRKNPEKYRKATEAKQLDPKLVDTLLELDDESEIQSRKRKNAHQRNN